MRIRALLISLVVCGVAPLSSSASDRPAVQPGQLFSNALLQIHAPTSDGWYGISQNADRIAFGKSGATRDESYIATVILFHIPDLTDTSAFTNFIKQGIEQDSPASRFEVLETAVNYSAERSYPCVRHQATSIDKKAAVPGINRKPMRIEVSSLYCQHPYRPNLGFMASFSHRGGAEDPYFAGDADKFINAVQVTPKTSEPAPKP